MSTRAILAAVGVGGVIAAGILYAPEAKAYPACGMGGPTISTPWGGWCDTEPQGVSGQYYHCQWGMGFQLCEWRWADGTKAPAPVYPS